MAQLQLNFVCDWWQETSIELLVIDDFGYLQSVCEQPVFGIIKDLALLPCNRKFRPDDPEVC
jgi:splicing factor 3B subunit 3